VGGGGGESLVWSGWLGGEVAHTGRKDREKKYKVQKSPLGENGTVERVKGPKEDKD